MNADQFRHREMKVSVLDFCDHCSTLKADVTKRSNYWPRIVDFNSCNACFTKLLKQINSPVAC